MAEDFLENYLLAHQSSNLDVSSPLECDYASKVRVHDYHAIDFLGYPGNTKNKEFELFLNGYCLLFKRKIYGPSIHQRIPRLHDHRLRKRQ